MYIYIYILVIIYVEWSCKECLTAWLKLGVCCRHPQLSLEGFLRRLQGSLRALGQALGVVLQSSDLKLRHLHDICTVMACHGHIGHIHPYPTDLGKSHWICFEMLHDASRCCKIGQSPAWRGQCLPLKTKSDSQPAAFGPWPQTISNIHGKCILKPFKCIRTYPLFSYV